MGPKINNSGDFSAKAQKSRLLYRYRKFSSILIEMKLQGSLAVTVGAAILQLPINGMKMAADGHDIEAQGLANFSMGIAFGNQSDDFLFARG